MWAIVRQSNVVDGRKFIHFGSKFQIFRAILITGPALCCAFGDGIGIRVGRGRRAALTLR
jgi:hypothetical protein